MAKVAANTITDLQFPRGQAPRIDPSSHAGQIGAAMAASARPYAQMAENAAAMGRRRVANIHARTREIQDAMGNFARGLSAGIEGVDAALDRRADEQADAEMARYSMHLLQNRDADYETLIGKGINFLLINIHSFIRNEGKRCLSLFNAAKENHR